jgi:hypothetical protein
MNLSIDVQSPSFKSNFDVFPVLITQNAPPEEPEGEGICKEYDDLMQNLLKFLVASIEMGIAVQTPLLQSRDLIGIMAERYGINSPELNLIEEIHRRLRRVAQINEQLQSVHLQTYLDCHDPSDPNAVQALLQKLRDAASQGEDQFKTFATEHENEIRSAVSFLSGGADLAGIAIAKLAGALLMFARFTGFATP